MFKFLRKHKEKMDTNSLQKLYDEWISRNAVKATQDFNDPAFLAIIDAGEAAVPFIYDKIKTSPDPVVHVLDHIYPDMVKAEGFVPLKEYCEAWCKALELNGTVPPVLM